MFVHKINYVSYCIASSCDDPPAAAGSAFQPSLAASRPSSQLHAPCVQDDQKSMHQVFDKNQVFSEAPSESSADIGLMSV
jgi:hypothetical protein